MHESASSICWTHSSDLMEKNKPREFNFLRETLSSIFSCPLFSTIIALDTLIFLFFPSHYSLRIIFSPVFISAALLLIFLLKLGATQREREFCYIQPPVDQSHRLLGVDHHLAVSNVGSVRQSFPDKDSSFERNESNSTEKQTQDLIDDDHQWVFSNENEQGPGDEPCREYRFLGKGEEPKVPEFDYSQPSLDILPNGRKLLFSKFDAAGLEHEPDPNHPTFHEGKGSDFPECSGFIDVNCNQNQGVCSESNGDPETDSYPCQRTYYEDTFVEWDVRAPLEVIYEEYEGEENERETQLAIIEKYASLSLYYPESDSDSSSDNEFPAIGDWDSPGETWRDEDDKEELIEIELDGKRCNHNTNGNNDFDEENLIEIDISPEGLPAR